jgi:hypothetical protein
MKIVLVDDGTLDTVLKCTKCGEVFRFNFQAWGADGPENTPPTYDDFVQQCIADTFIEHECPP